MSVASLYLGGGWVKCWVGERSWRSSALADRQGREERVLLLSAGREDPAVAVEAEDFPLGLEDAFAGRDLDVRHLEPRRGHLAGDEPAEDQLIELELVDREPSPDRFGRQAQVGRPDRLVGLLGELAGGVACSAWRGRSVRAVLVLDQVADAGDGIVGDAEAVRPHIGDEAGGAVAADVDPLVEFLGDLHRPLAGEPETDRGLLLEGARLERGLGLVGFLDGPRAPRRRNRPRRGRRGSRWRRPRSWRRISPSSSSASSAENRDSAVESPPGASWAVIRQYSSLTNARISFSRSAIRRTATDWTRPALRFRATFFQRSGLIW